MSSLALEALLILVLLLANGVFAMAEIAVVSSRKARLQQLAEAGDAGARRALEIARDPTRFLSTVQIGITLVGILAGAFGGATLSEKIGPMLVRQGVSERYAEGVALGGVVILITYLSLVVGELVPKRIGLTAPERIAARVAGPMGVLSRLASLPVRFLGFSTDLVLRLLRVRDTGDTPVTEEEIAVLIDQGTEAGVFEEEEHDLVERVFWLGDQDVAALMTPRRRIVWLDLAATPEQVRETMRLHRLSRFLVCEGSLERVEGMVEVKDLWAAALAGEPMDLRAALRRPLFIPEGTRALALLQLFRESGVHLAVVVDEYGGIDGLVTLNDLLDEIAGGTQTTGPQMVRRDDGSWLVDGSLGVEDFRERLGLPDRRADERASFRTVGGLVLSRLGRIPTAGEHFEWEGFRVEVVDMDGPRVDKLLVAGIGEEKTGSES